MSAKSPRRTVFLRPVAQLSAAMIGQAVYIGDSDVDGQTAANAGCDCILVSWGFRGRETLLPFGCPIADSTGELLTILTEGEK